MLMHAEQSKDESKTGLLNPRQTHTERHGFHHCGLQSQAYIHGKTLVSFDCTETQGIAGCDAISAVVAFALTRVLCASSFSKLLVLPYLFCALLQSHISSPHATLMNLH